MRTSSRSWPALFAWGAGLLHIALAAEAGRAAAALGMLAAAALLLQGAGELAWGIAALVRGRPVAPRTALVGAVTGLTLAASAIPAGGSPIAVAAVVLLLVPAAVLTWTAKEVRRSRPRSWGQPVGMVVGAVLVAALITPALSTTVGGGHGHLDMASVDPHAGH
ncbi:hypothetical protein LK09_11955 [Microbacterium mangrovi]|uniref:Uncharacterized protein n=1 Tax=Microbacterium mangrovi TaxID=1348253 RepID=A0A0B2A6R5_9MICO|nr:hypothetical protein [Microbacterium mangrovi]KHK97463.1 hypothetical protein LK09_11955 [Microbacterium mangrovi]